MTVANCGQEKNSYSNRGMQEMIINPLHTEYTMDVVKFRGWHMEGMSSLWSYLKVI